MSTKVEKRELVIPGQLLAEGDYISGENTYKIDEKIFSLKVGLFDLFNKKLVVVPIKSCYIPFIEDYVIGRVTNSEIFGWFIYINSPYLGLLPSSDLSGQRHREKETSDRAKIFVGDLVKAKVVAFDRTRDPLLTVRERGLGKISSGKIIEISPAKIPRLIGKGGSMIGMLKNETSCQIFIGRNGIVHVSGNREEDVDLTLWAIKKIDEEAHTSGLTDRLSEDLKKRRVT